MANNFRGYAQNLEPDGTVLMLGGKALGTAGYTKLRQVDLAGDTLRETNIQGVNAKLAGMHEPQILDFDHEAKLLPNGDTVVVGTTPKSVDYQGRSTKFIGDLVIVLDQNFQPVWVWNSFRWLDTNRIGFDHPVPTDWLHANIADSMNRQKTDPAVNFGRARPAISAGSRASGRKGSPYRISRATPVREPR